MNEYRCTRNAPYTSPRCYGHTDLSEREGHYIKAESEQDAIAQMSKLYPRDEDGFIAQIWKIDCLACRLMGKHRPHTTINAERLPPASLCEEPAEF